MYERSFSTVTTHDFPLHLLGDKDFLCLTFVSNSETSLVQQTPDQIHALGRLGVQSCIPDSSSDPTSTLYELFPTELGHDDRFAFAWLETDGRTRGDVKTENLLEGKDSIETQRAIRLQEWVMGSDLRPDGENELQAAHTIDVDETSLLESVGPPRWRP